MKKLKKLFTKDLQPRQRQYEAIRAVALEGLSCVESATKFGYSPQTVRNLKQMVLSGKLNFFPETPSGPKGARTDDAIISRILELRKEKKSIYEIFDLLTMDGMALPLSSIAKIIAKSGIGKLDRRTDQERNIETKNKFLANRVEVLDFKKLGRFKIDCPVAGIFLFLPYIIESGIIDIVKRCALPGSSDIDCTHAALSILALKLIGVERLSHIRTYDQEPALGIFSGLSGLPKPSYMGSYWTAPLTL